MRFNYSLPAGEIIGFYELNNFPGCNQIVVSNHVRIKPEYRGNGHGKRMQDKRIQEARELGFDYMMATVVATNEVQMKIMRKNRWKELDRFHNSETGNEVVIFGRKVEDENFEQGTA